MLNRNNAGSDEDSNGSDYVLLEAEEPEEELTADPAPETEALLAPEDPLQDLSLEGASDLLLDEIVDEPKSKVEAEVEDENKGFDASSVKNEEETNTTDEPDDESKLPSKSNPKEPKAFRVEGIEAVEVAVPEKIEVDTSNFNIDDVLDDVAERGHVPSRERDLEDGFKNADPTKSEETENGDDSGDENYSESDSTGTPGGDEESEPEVTEEETNKENNVPEKAKQDLGSREYKFGTRGEVNGAAAIFGVTGLVVGGPVLGLISAAASAHIAANKPCKCATFTRRCGSAIGNIGHKKRDTREKKPHLWDKITDRLVEGGAWTEQTFAPLRRIKPMNHKYGSKSRSPTT